MPDPPKSTQTFSFGNTSNSGSNSLFGSVAPNSSTSGSFLGSGTAQPSSQGSSMFGASKTTSTTSSAPSQPSLFGAGSGTGQSGTIFGGQSTAGNPFATNNNSNTTFSGLATPSKPVDAQKTDPSQSTTLFGGGASVGGGIMFGGKGSTPTSSTQGRFSTPATNKPSGGFPFTGLSTTPAGPPPTGSGAGPGFGLRKPQEQTSNIFGGLGTQSSSSATMNTPAPSNLYSGVSSAGNSNLFGSSKPTDAFLPNSTTSKASSLFAKPSSISDSNVFGATSATSGSSSSPFSAQSKPQETSSQTTQGDTTQSSSLFPGVSGQKQLDTQSSSFGGSTSDAPPTAPRPNFTFPPATTTPPTTSISTDTATSTAPNLFGKPKGQSILSPAPNSADPPSADSRGSYSHLGTEKGKGVDNISNTTTSDPAAPSSTAPPVTSSLWDKPNHPATSKTHTHSKTAAAAATFGEDAAKINNLGTSTVGPRPPAQSRLRNKTMDEIITRWASDLSKYQKEFQRQALKVSEWDRMLVENSEKIQKLYGSTLEAERATAEVERQLSGVENDQRELELWLEHYEQQVDDIIATQVGQGDTLQGPDQERERTYKLTEKLSDRLNEMGKDLTSMIENINDASSDLSKNTKANDPLSQIVRVLNGHLSQLQQIDQGTAALQAKVLAAQRASRTSSSTNGTNGMGSDAADDFYNSYMGRR